MIPEYPVYLFDVDGTLVDSAEDICGAVRSALNGLPHLHCDERVLRGYIGHHLREFFNDLVPGRTPEEFDEFLERYRAIYRQRQHASTRLYPGVIEALSVLPGRKSTATTKNTPTVQTVLEKFGLLRFFDHVQGTDGFAAKPEPEVILRALEALGAKPEDCLMVGDAVTDMEAGRRAGVRICAVRYGYGDHQAMARWQPDYWIDDLRELSPTLTGAGSAPQVRDRIG